MNDQQKRMEEHSCGKSKGRWLALAVAVVSCAAFLWESLAKRLMTMLLPLNLGESASLGVIGGADGPTAIYVTTTIRSDYGWLLSLGVAIAATAVWWHLGHLKKK